MDRNGVFISYSKKDVDWLNKIKVPLRFLEISNAFNIWDDTKIKVSADWNNEIETSLRQCKVAIMLISNDFLATEFILKKEIPALLNGAQREGARIFNIILDFNVFKMTPLSRYQSVNNPDQPLSHLPEVDQQKILVKLAEEVKAALDCEQQQKFDRLPDFGQLAIVLSTVAGSVSGNTISQVEAATKLPRRSVVKCLEQLSANTLIEKDIRKSPEQKKPSTFWKATIKGLEVQAVLKHHFN